MPGRQVIVLVTSIRLRAPLIAFAILGMLVGVVGRAAWAAPPKPGSTWSADWAVVGPRAGAAGSLSGLRWESPMPGLTVTTGGVDGRFESPVHDMRHEFMALGASWQAQVPPGAVLVLEVEVGRPVAGFQLAHSVPSKTGTGCPRWRAARAVFRRC